MPPRARHVWALKESDMDIPITREDFPEVPLRVEYALTFPLAGAMWPGFPESRKPR